MHARCRLLWLAVCAGLASCSAKTAHAPGGPSGGAASEASAGEGAGATGPNLTVGGSVSGGAGACSSCPHADGIESCCDQFCGYLNTESKECTASLAGSRVLPVVTAPTGELCPDRPACPLEPGCPRQIPADGSPCAGEARCNYCAAPSYPRLVVCRAQRWASLGPSPPCGYTIEP